MDSRDPPARSDPETVDLSPTLPPEFGEAFLDAEGLIARRFGPLAQEPGLARLEIGGERYILVRAASLSLRFFELFQEVLGSLLSEEATHHAAREVLYDLAHAIGRADARALLPGFDTPERRLALAPVHFAYTGWARVRLHEESDASGTEPWLHFDHLHSFEADAYLQAQRASELPVCVMNAGYAAGWTSESFGIRMESTELTCRARGDAECSFVMAPPEQLERRWAEIAPRYPTAAPPPPFLLGERLLDKLAAAESARDETQASLLEHQATLASFFAQAPVGAFFTGLDPQGQIVVEVANPAAYEILGTPGRALLGQPLADALGLLDPESVVAACADALAGRGGALHDPERPFRGPQGEGVLDLHVFAIGQRQLAVLFRDRTAALQAEEAQRDADRLEATATLAGGIAHDFNNLMAGVLSQVNVLRRSQPPWEETDLILGEVQRAAELASDLSRQLVSYARGGKYEVRRVRVSDLVQDALERPPGRSGVRLERRVSTTRDAVLGDPRQLGRLLRELIQNALEAVGPRGRVVIGVSRRRVPLGPEGSPPPGDYVALEVRDDGPGIAPEVQRRMFEPYFSTRGQGRGLGLAAAYGVVKNHGGLFEVESGDGPETTVRVLLPAAGTHALPEAGSALLLPSEPPPEPPSLISPLGSMAEELTRQLSLARQAAGEDRAGVLAALERCDRIAARLREQSLVTREPQRPCDPRELLTQVSRAIQVPGSIEVALEVPQDLPSALGARRQLESALLNLCSNSRDALLPEGGRITLSAAVVEGRLRLEVRDTGPGMAPELLARAREPFFTTTGGTGLGLSLVEQVARAHGGALEIRSSPGQGTSTAILLPLAEAPPAPPAPPAPRCVLIVDDNPHVGRSTARLLELEGYRAILAETGAEARAVLDEQIDAVLLDLVLPDASGDEVFHELRARRPGLPIVLFSGYGEQADVSRLLSEGAVFIPKPFEVDELLRALATVLEAT